MARVVSYGSCDGMNDQKPALRAGHNRQLIGSDVLDFGEWPTVWPSLPTPLATRRLSRNTFTWLKFSDSRRRSAAVGCAVHSSTKMSMARSQSTTMEILPKHNDPCSGQVAVKASAEAAAAPNSIFALFGLNTSSKQLPTARTDSQEPIESDRERDIAHELQNVSKCKDIPTDLPMEKTSCDVNKFLIEMASVSANGSTKIHIRSTNVTTPVITEEMTPESEAMEATTDNVKRSGADRQPTTAKEKSVKPTPSGQKINATHMPRRQSTTSSRSAKSSNMGDQTKPTNLRAKPDTPQKAKSPLPRRQSVRKSQDSVTFGPVNRSQSTKKK